MLNVWIFLPNEKLPKNHVIKNQFMRYVFRKTLRKETKLTQTQFRFEVIISLQEGTIVRKQAILLTY